MTARKISILDCDWPGCDTHTDSPWTDTHDAAREEAARHEWTRRDEFDFCRHHPGLTGHAPAFAVRNHVGTSASCSCGWEDETAWYSPRRAQRTWTQHLPPETWIECSRARRDDERVWLDKLVAEGEAEALAGEKPETAPEPLPESDP